MQIFFIYCKKKKKTSHTWWLKIKKNQNTEAGNTNCLFSTFFATTEMLKHLNTEKKLDDIITCVSIFFLFFICLAITTDDIARHWESSSKAWETVVANQIMRHGVIHLRVTLTLLPLWHTHARPKSASLSLSLSLSHAHTRTLSNWKS